MRITRSGRFVFIAQWVAAVLLPAFLIIGRVLVGADIGWLAVIGIVYGGLLVVLMLVPPVLTLLDRGVRKAKATRQGYDIASFALWAAFVVAGLTVPDAGDGGPLDSALTTWTGGAIGNAASEAIFTVVGLAAIVAYLVVLVLAIAGVARWRRPFDA